mmetsp:Transcript_7222/g.16953  ORF Transcript_7222/g.16953 Transcript_7222/m.16953 type:complete len:1018 (+) Transcript_7222:108-3161(+)
MPLRTNVMGMPPTAAGPTGMSDEKSNWVNVTWMPHSCLSQTSHICLSVRSVLTLMEQHSEIEEWQVRVTVHGAAGLSLVPVATTTSTSPRLLIRDFWQSHENGMFDKDAEWLPLVSNVSHICKFDSVIHIPIRWRDLPRDAYLLFEVLGYCDKVLFQSMMPMFDAYGKMQSGLTKLDLTPPSQGVDRLNEGLLPPPQRGDNTEWQIDDPVWKASKILDQLERVEKSKADATTNRGGFKSFGEIQSVPWLDKMTKDYCEQTLSEARAKNEYRPVYDTDTVSAHLIVELPIYDVPVMHEETFYPVAQHGPSGTVTPLDVALHQQGKLPAGKPSQFHPLQAIPFLDYENENDNPVEDKYRALAHDLLRGLVDPALKPDRVQRDQLAAIIASSSHQPTREEKDLLWRFRFSLVDNRRALAKFLLAVEWTVESEVVQAAELLEQWRKRSPIMVTDALKLLGKQVAYQTNLVRAYAIDTLAAAPDEELSLYLLQLVQALKFENIQETGSNMTTQESEASLATFLIGRAAKNIQLATYLYWYLKVELQDPTHGARYTEIFSQLESVLAQTAFTRSKKPEQKSLLDASTPMKKVEKAAEEIMAVPFKNIVDSVSKKIGSSLKLTDSESQATDGSLKKKGAKSVWDVLKTQDVFISGVMDAQLSCGSKGKKDAKEAHIRSVLSKEGYDKNHSRDSFPLPCAPEVQVNGLNSQTAKIFKSAVYPALIEFHIESIAAKGDFGMESSKKDTSRSKSSKLNPLAHQSIYKVIVKTGDDLRQDQLAMMMIKLMDGLLKRASLDLCLTPYSIIATSPTSGLVEFVGGSMPVSAVLANHNNSVMQYFQAVAPQKGAKYDIRPDVLSSYIRSCAGYCVLTYILGVGDRHLDNILICKTGHFFHIDFGFMFGRDPKPLPPAFRLTREMVEGMGGLESTEYRQFCSLACQAFNALRKNAGLVLNLLSLMSDAGIEDLSNNPSADPEGVIAKVEERFRLDLTDEQAERFFLNLIGETLAAIAPRVMDVFHSIAVARR